MGIAFIVRLLDRFFQEYYDEHPALFEQMLKRHLELKVIDKMLTDMDKELWDQLST